MTFIHGNKYFTELGKFFKVLITFSHGQAQFERVDAVRMQNY